MNAMSKARALVGRSRRGSSGDADLVARVAQLEEAVEESRRLNQRLSEVLDVMVEILVPVTDRDEERLSRLLATIETTR